MQRWNIKTGRQLLSNFLKTLSCNETQTGSSDNDCLLVREIFAADPSFTFTEASNGKMALTQLQAEPFDLVLLEVWRETNEALHFCHTMKNSQIFQVVNVAFLTIHSSIRCNAYHADADGFLAKPYYPDDLETFVYRLLHRPKGLAPRTTRYDSMIGNDWPKEF